MYVNVDGERLHHYSNNRESNQTKEKNMRKAAFLAAAALAAVLSSQPNVAVAAGDLNQNTHNFIRDALNPYAATAQPSSNMRHMHDHMHHHMRHHGMHHRHHMKHGKM